MGPTLSHFFRINPDPGYETFNHTLGEPNTYDEEGYDATGMDVVYACGQCHQVPGKTQMQYTTAQLSVLAEGMHTAAKTSGFTATADGVVSKQVNFVATPAGASFEWNFGDGTTATVATAATSHIYPAAGTYMAVVKVDGAISPIKGVTVTAINTPPTPSANVSVAGWVVTIVDSSSDAESAQVDLDVTVGCGSGGVVAPSATQAGGSTFTCTYTTAGTRYITHKAVDPDGATGMSANTSVYVPTKYTVKGKVTKVDGTTPIYGVILYLNNGIKNTNSTSSKSDGTFTFTGVVPGTYSVKALKSGYTFTDPEISGLVVDGNEIDVNFSSN
jgi:hypothetical protein